MPVIDRAAENLAAEAGVPLTAVLRFREGVPPHEPRLERHGSPPGRAPSAAGNVQIGRQERRDSRRHPALDTQVRAEVGVGRLAVERVLEEVRDGLRRHVQEAAQFEHRARREIASRGNAQRVPVDGEFSGRLVRSHRSGEQHAVRVAYVPAPGVEQAKRRRQPQRLVFVALVAQDLDVEETPGQHGQRGQEKAAREERPGAQKRRGGAIDHRASSHSTAEGASAFLPRR